MTYRSKRLSVERNGLKFGTRVLIWYIWCTFDLFHVEGHLRLFSAIISKWPVTRKQAGLKFGTRGTSITQRGTFDVVVFKLILRSLSALYSKWPVTRKWLALEPKGLKFGTRMVERKYPWPFSVQSNFGVIRCTCFKMACNLKTAGPRANLTEIWGSGVLPVINRKPDPTFSVGQWTTSGNTRWAAVLH